MIVGVIADGNRRWAKSEKLTAQQGHQKGFDALTHEVLPACYDEKTCTGLVIYAFSTENWKRDPFEIHNLMNLYAAMCDTWEETCLEKKIAVRWCGRRDRVPRFLKTKIEILESKTQHFNTFSLYLCLDYGGQDEIERAVKKKGENFLEALEVPEIDLVIRTGGEQRISNFCIWQVAYSEFFFPDYFLPEIKEKDVKDIFSQFLKKDRRKGGNSHITSS